MVRRLLTLDPVERLGCGGGGVRDVLAAELLQEILTLTLTPNPNPNPNTNTNTNTNTNPNPNPLTHDLHTRAP